VSDKIDIINYLDKHAVVENRKVSPFNLQQLMEEFPDVDEFSLRLWHKEWMTERNIMLSIEF
jgi:hypothetical protein